MKGALMPSRLPLVGLQICNKIVRTAAEWLARQNGRGQEEGKNKFHSSEHFHSIIPVTGLMWRSRGDMAVAVTS